MALKGMQRGRKAAKSQPVSPARRNRKTKSLKTVRRSETGDDYTEELRLQRRYAIYGLLILPLIGALYGFFGLQNAQTVWPEAIAEVTPRGRILTRDGTVFAEGGVDYRRYPQGSLAAHVIGFSGQRQKGDRYGLEGLENTRDAELAAGEDVTITIDPHMQSVAQTKVREMVRRAGAENGSAVMLEAQTGRILAAVSYPEYDPNTQADLFDRNIIINKAFLNLYEPGSVMKPFVIAALLESGRLGLDEVIATPVNMQVGDKIYYESAYHDPYLTPWGILRYSSNTGMLDLTKRLEDDELLAWLMHFGFGRDIPVPSIYTRSGQLRDTPWVPQDQASITIGQSMSTTTLQLAAAYSIFANDGLYVPPYIVEGDQPGEPRQMLSANTARTLRDMMAYVVESNETMRNAMAPGVSVAGKTGTADIFDQATRSYIDDDYNLTFAGMFPADAPKVTMVVSLQKPRTDTSSITVAAPLFGNIQREVVSLWQPGAAAYNADKRP